jgi:hypothetical protein
MPARDEHASPSPADLPPDPPLQNTFTRVGGAFTIGAAARCLSRALAQGEDMEPACRSLVLAAAPADSRAYLR